MAKDTTRNQSYSTTSKKSRELAITEVRYMPVQDAEARLSRAIDILLGVMRRQVSSPEEDDGSRSDNSKSGACKDIEGINDV